METKTQRPILAIGAIVKNEAPYLLEWIAYHRVLGVSRFFIADDSSGDGSSYLLDTLSSHGILYAIPFPNLTQPGAQLRAYTTIMKFFSRMADWVAFIDVDEFLYPTDGSRDLSGAMTAIHKLDDVGAVAVNWAIYGSSGQLYADSGIVTQRFVHRGEKAHNINCHFKSIVRCSSFSSVGVTPHEFVLSKGFRTVSTKGKAVERGPTKGSTAAVGWERLRINHYVIKSYEEFLFRKRPKGMAMGEGHRDLEFFQAHDLNDVRDPIPDWLLNATKSEMSNLMSLVKRGQGK